MKIYNSLTRKKEEFIPLNPGKVSMYVCGPTVYNYFHIGNGRTFIVFDTIRRYMEYRGYEVNFVQNFTDIDDKMINKANEENTTVKEIGINIFLSIIRMLTDLILKELLLIQELQNILVK